MTRPTDLAAPLVQANTAAAARRADRKRGLIRLASPFVILALWQLGSALGLIPEVVLPVR